MSLVLASGSPRRRLLLETAGIAVSAVRPPHIPEQRLPGEAPVAYARRLAGEKAFAVEALGAWVLAADTVVHIDDDIYEKPVDDADAARILRALSGRWHRVTTAWCLRWGGGPGLKGPAVRHGHVTARVAFRALTEPEILRYVASGEGRDKAGSYGIQERGVFLIDRVVGSFTTVVGLPMTEVLAALARVGLRPDLHAGARPSPPEVSP